MKTNVCQKITLLSLIAIGFLGSTVHASAYVIDSATTNTTSLTSWSSTSENVADYFETVGAGEITSAQFCAGVGSGTPTGVTLKVWADAGGTPSTLLGESDPITVTDPNHLHDFSFPTPVIVSAAQGYWIGISGPTSGVIENCGIASELGVYGTKYTTNNGSSWSGEQDWTQYFTVTVTEDVPPTPTATSTMTVVHNPTLDMFLGIVLFFMVMVFVIWFFRRPYDTY